MFAQQAPDSERYSRRGCESSALQGAGSISSPLASPEAQPVLVARGVALRSKVPSVAQAKRRNLTTMGHEGRLAAEQAPLTAVAGEDRGERLTEKKGVFGSICFVIGRSIKGFPNLIGEANDDVPFVQCLPPILLYLVHFENENEMKTAERRTGAHVFRPSLSATVTSVLGTTERSWEFSHVNRSPHQSAARYSAVSQQNYISPA